MDIEKKYYSSDEVSKMLNCDCGKINRLASKYNIRVTKKHTGRRKYTTENILQLRRVLTFSKMSKEELVKMCIQS